MSSLDPKLIQEIMSRFHAGRFSGSVKENFHHWLISPRDHDSKEKAMEEVWDSLVVPANQSTYESLKEVKAKLGMVSKPVRKISLNRGFMRIAAALIPVAVIAGSYFIYTGIFELEWAKVEVPYGETEYYKLADGTEVWLNSGSVFEYPVKFKGRKREVKLRGEAFFDVTHDKKKPFVVATANMKAQVVGTSFNINCYDGMKHESVTVLDGQVNVTTKDEKIHELTPDRHLVHCIYECTTNVEEVDAASLVLWMENGLVFENNTFEDMLNHLQRKFNFKLKITDSTVLDNNSVYRMQFVNDESLNYILDVLHSIVGLPYKLEDGMLIVGHDLKEASENGKQTSKSRASKNN